MEVDRLCISSAATAAIAASPALNGIVRLAIKLVEHHGKSGCDGNSNTPVLALKTLSSSHFTKTIVADADGSKFVDSKKHSSFVGRHTSAQVRK